MFVTRRNLLATAGAFVASTGVSSAFAQNVDGPVVLDWSDLIPDGSSMRAPVTFTGDNVVEHGQMGPRRPHRDWHKVRADLNGKLVELPGYAVPLRSSGAATAALLLVPYVGACIHVPPPPPNQLVHVSIAQAHEIREVFEPVWVKGVMNTSGDGIELADVGYFITEASISPYR